MSKNTSKNDFRKVDVDELDEENYRDEAEKEEGNEADQLSQREGEVRKFVSSSNNVEALKAALENPPVDKSLKERNFNIVLDVLTRFKSSDVEKGVNALNERQRDVLMKFIYRGFAYPTENSCGILLVWHEKLVTASGVGCIVRVMADRKTV